MAQSDEVVSTVKINNRLVATERALNFGNVYEGICNMVSELRIIASKRTDEEHMNKISNHLVETEPALNLGNVYNEICNVVSELRIIATKQTNEEQMNKISLFFASQPPSFGEDTDPFVAKCWIRKLEKIFNLIGFSDEQKVCLASLRLKDAASSWWMDTDLEDDDGVTTVTWEKFKQAFERRYLSRRLKIRKFCELRNLEQGDRTVTEYDEQFMKLASVAREYIPDQTWEAHQFNSGLRDDIRMQLFLVNNVSYDEVRNSALMVEESINNREI